MKREPRFVLCHAGIHTRHKADDLETLIELADLLALVLKDYRHKIIESYTGKTIYETEEKTC